MWENRQLELREEPDDVSELMQFHDKANSLGVTFCGWAEKVVSWDGLNSWWRCEDHYNNNK